MRRWRHVPLTGDRVAGEIPQTMPGLVSVIIPHFNTVETLGVAIDSVRYQTYRAWELIVVDDCSTEPLDALVDLVEEDDRISLIRLPSNSGTPGAPRNKGIELARGEFIAFLDADDIWHPGKLEIQVNFLIGRSADFCFSDVYPFRDQRTYQEVVGSAGPLTEPPFRTLDHARLLRKNVIRSGSSVVLRAAAIGELRFMEDRAFRAVEDYLFWLSLHQSRVKESFWLRLDLVGYRLSESSISKSKVFMIRQHYRAYRSYRVGGKRLGVRAYYYLITYAATSLVRILVNLGRWSRLPRVP